jgi:hypothetical protein
MNEATAKSKINEFKDALQCGIDGIIRASEIYVKAIDEDPSVQSQFWLDLGDVVPISAWKQFEAIGRKWVHPRLLFGGVSSKVLMAEMRRAPYSVQARVFNGDRFDLLLDNGRTLRVSPLEATYSQVQQLFHGGAIRSISEQKAFLEERRAKAVSRLAFDPEPMPYTITKGKVLFRRDTEMTKRELIRIIEEMK